MPIPPAEGDGPRPPDELPLVAAVLAGGMGTRLRSVVADRPKVMAEVAGRPFLDWQLLRLQSQGIRKAVLCTGHLGEIIESHVDAGGPWNMEIVCSREPRPLGTAGAVRHSLGHLTADRVLVMNGDSYCPVDVRRLLDAHVGRGAAVTVWTTVVEDVSRFGAVTVAEDGRVLAFGEKAGRGRGLINTGTYVMERETIRSIPKGTAVSLEYDVFPELIGRGLYAVPSDAPFIDIGTPESYAAADRFFADNVLGRTR